MKKNRLPILKSMKKLLALFAIHFFIIITFQSYLFISAAFEKNDVIILSYLKQQVYNNSAAKYYLLFSGINTGYGFYGINVATNKYYFVEAFDQKNKLITKTDVSDFQTKNSYCRFTTLPSWLYNFNVETEDLRKKGRNKETKKYCELRDRYLRKVYECIGVSSVKHIKNCKNFNIKLVTVVPPNIWNSDLEKNNIYVLQKFSFKNK